jgi:hypothetical protein
MGTERPASPRCVATGRRQSDPIQGPPTADNRVMESRPDPVHRPSPVANGAMDGTRSNRGRTPQPVQPPRPRVSGGMDPTHRPSPSDVLGMETDPDGFRPAEGHTG